MKTKWTILSVILLCTQAATVQAQFGYSTNAGGASISITSYSGPGGSVSIPTNYDGFMVTSIGQFAFAESTLTSITIGDTVTNIGPYAFEDCERLTSVTIPGSVTSLGNGTFLGCDNLPNVTIPGTVASIGGYAFNFCDSLASVTIGNGVSSIGEYAFADTSLAGVTIPATVTNIGAAPFEGCSLLTAITVDSGNLFYTSTNGVLFDKTQAALVEYPAGQGESYTIPPGVTSIAAAAFADTSVTNALIPNSVTNIGAAPFSGCSLLTAITVASENLFYSSTNGVLFDKSQNTLLEYPEGKSGSYTIPMGVTSIESNAFTECANLTSVIFPESVTNIGEFAFTYSGLRSFAIGSGVTTIGQYGFEGCAALASVTIPRSVTTIGNAAFVSCTNLASVSIPDSVSNLGTGVFDACYGLATVTIGTGVTNLGNAVFAFCDSLTGVYFQGNAPSAISSVFRGDTATIYYLAGTEGWSDLSAVTGLPTVLWNPMIQTSGPNFGVSDNQFGFNVIGTTNIPIVVEASTNLASPDWIPLRSVTLTNGLFYFSELLEANISGRYYRISAP